MAFMAAVGPMLAKVGPALAKAGGALVSGVKAVGSKIASSALAQGVKTVGSKIASSAVSSGVKNVGGSLINIGSKVAQGAKTVGGTVVKYTKNPQMIADKAAKGVRAANKFYKANEGAIKGISTAGSVAMSTFSLIDSHNQYKDAMERQSTYEQQQAANIAAQEANALKIKQEYSDRANSFAASLANSSTSLNNIYSSGYSEDENDSILSSSLKSKYRYSMI